MGTVTSFITRFFLLLFHLGCFFFPTASTSTPPAKKRKVSSAHHEKSRRRYLSLVNPWSYLKPIFCPKKASEAEPLPRIRVDHAHPLSSQQHSIPSPRMILSTPTHRRKRSSCGSFTESEICADLQPKRLSSSSFSASTGGNGNGNDSAILPCPTCGEVFQKSSRLEHHQSTKHALTELLDGDSGKNIVRIIFQTGWNGNKGAPSIERILKIHNSPKMFARFEEYREAIKAKASRSSVRQNERCAADGNELLRFHCSTYVCSLGEGEEGICGKEVCSICGIIRSGFSPKLEGISSMGSGSRAHEAIPEGMEEEFAFMKMRRAMLLCRVVAGRVASEFGAVVSAADKEDGGFDSVVVGQREGDELLVFNPRAVLPCFVIIYTV